MAREAELAVELVAHFTNGGSESNIPPELDEKVRCLRSGPEYRALVVHAALVERLPLASVTRVTAYLGAEPEWVATLLPLDVLQEFGSQVPAYRKQYQRIMAEQTRTLTYDLFSECTAGYGLLAQTLQSYRTWEYEKLWTKALEVIGMFDLEPVKAMALFISLLDTSQYSSFAAWIALGLWRQFPDWIAVTKLVRVADRAQMYACLVLNNIVSLEDVSGIYTQSAAKKLKEYEDSWKTENLGTVNRLSALAMAMPLADDDDDDDENYHEEMDLDEDLLANNAQSGEALPQSEPPQPKRSAVELADEDSSDHEFVETLRSVVGHILLLPVEQQNAELASKVVALVNSYPLVFGTCDLVLQGMSRLLAAKLTMKTANTEENPRTADNVRANLQALHCYWHPISHSVLEPAWSAIGQYIMVVAEPEAKRELFRMYMLPSIDCHSSNLSFLRSFTIEERFMLYTDLYTRLAVTNDFVKARFMNAERNTKDVLKRLTKKDAELIIVPQLLQEFSHCAWPSLNVFVNQVESYNIGKLVAQAATPATTKSAKFAAGDADRHQKPSQSAAFSELAMDMLPLVLMQQFTVGRDATQRDGLHMSRWLRLLAQFAGDIATSHPQFDFVALIKFVLHQFAANNWSLIFVVDQILRQLSGIPNQSNLSPFQLLALGSSPLVAELAQKEISEVKFPQPERLLSQLRNDPQGNLLTVLVMALSYGYDYLINEPDAKVLASRQDAITNLVLLLRHFPLDSSVPRANIATKFGPYLIIGEQEERPVEFNSLNLYDVAVEPKIYAAAQPRLDEKSLDRALLSHRIRVKAVKQRLQSCPLPSLNAQISRLLLSPADALFTSRYLQLREASGAETWQPLLSRDVILAVLNGATPLETESFAIFVTDMLSHLYRNLDTIPLTLHQLKELLTGFTNAILEAAVPEAPFTVLNNVFNLVQRTLSVFPVFRADGENLRRRIQLLTTTTKGDLETAVKSLEPQLLQRQKVWCESELTPEFLANLTLHADRLMARFAAGLRVNSK